MDVSVGHSDRLAELGTDNRAQCFAALRRGGSQSLADLAQATGLSRPTVKTHLDALLAMGLVVASERATTSKGGRPKSTYSLNPDGALLAAFDVSRHEHRFLLCDLAGVIRAGFVEEVPGDLAMSERAELVVAGLGRLVESAGSDPAQIRRYSGSIGAQVSSGGAILRNIGDVALLDVDFSTRLTQPVTLENDLKASAYAEQRIGCAQGVSDVIYALAWHKVAAGIIIDGRIHRGVHELAGELNLVNGTSHDDEDWTDWPTFLGVVQQAEAGDAAASASVERFCGKAALQVALLAMALDPEMIVLGGPLVHRSQHFVERLRSALDHRLSEAPHTSVELTALRSWAPALGAVLRGLEALEADLIGAPNFEYMHSNSTQVELPLPKTP